jgi:hypothetical protein
MTYVDGTVCLTSDGRVTTNCVLQRVWIDAVGPISFWRVSETVAKGDWLCLSDGLSTSPPVRQCVCSSVPPIRKEQLGSHSADFHNVLYKYIWLYQRLEHIGPIPILVYFGQKFKIRYIKNYAPFNTCAVFVFVCEAGCALCEGRAEAKNIFNITEIMFSVTCGLRMKQLILGNWVLSMVIFETSAFKACLFKFPHLRHLSFNWS